MSNTQGSVSRLSKHLKFRKKCSAVGRIFSTMKQSLVFDTLLQTEEQSRKYDA